MALIKAEHDEILKALDAAKAGPPELETLTCNLESLRNEHDRNVTRMEELRKALKLLEEEDANIVTRIEETESQVAEIKQLQAVQVDELANKLSAQSTAIGFSGSVDLVVESFQQLDDTLSNANTSISNMPPESGKVIDDMVDVAINKLNMFLLRARNYFAAEADCVDFLRRRVDDLDCEIKRMVRVLFCGLLGV
jgi:chromosome segregation ATPase